MTAAAHGQTEDRFTVPAFAVPADFKIPDSVAVQLKKTLDFCYDIEKTPVFLAPLINIFRKISKERPYKKNVRRDQQNIGA